jgi:hypothetical protein
VFVAPEVLQRLTGKVRYSAQRKILDERRIRYIVAESGEPLVRPEALDDATGRARHRGPKWERLKNARA